MLFYFDVLGSSCINIKLFGGWARAIIVCLLSAISFSSSADVVISEFMASNDSTILDEDGDDSDWIELHNDGANSVSINGWYLTDDDGKLTKWKIPNVTLSANDYLVCLLYTSPSPRDRG